ncbi:hypothetical protein [Sunxiuqinia sp. sy24]|uniref:hypothetical protein n=1 Tax=Sunxiuqinia sp. sy24 TaxID=3461495 RepID=UPI0040461307
MQTLQELNYQISIKVKSKHWYDVAEEYGGAKAFAEWDDGKTIRYKRGISFKFKHPVSSIEEIPNSTFQIKLVNQENENDFITVALDNVRVMKCKGDQESSLVISESICDIEQEVKKGEDKKYYHYYLKDDPVYELMPNLWLSSEHYKMLQNKDYQLIQKQEVEIIEEQGIIKV